jgi:hypothetical protein
MATTTPNYGWAVPTSTDLVKDGATAIETLGDAIDASMNTALGTKKAGMVLLNTTSFSGVASQSINDVFSATYTNYKIVGNVTNATAAGVLSLRYRVSGADRTTGYYSSNYYLALNTASFVQDSQVTTYNRIGYVTGTGNNDCTFECTIYRPFATAYTYQNSSAIRGDAYLFTAGGWTDSTTSYTGLTISNNGGGNISGKVSIYGINE